MTILTMLWTGFLLHARARPSYIEDPNAIGEDPRKYNIWKSFYARSMATEPQVWNTTEELGIVFSEKIEGASGETYLVLISDSEKALPWMKYDPEFTPHAVEYQGAFYHIRFLWITPAINVPKWWELPSAACVAVSWILVVGILLPEDLGKREKQ